MSILVSLRTTAASRRWPERDTGKLPIISPARNLGSISRNKSIKESLELERTKAAKRKERQKGVLKIIGLATAFIKDCRALAAPRVRNQRRATKKKVHGLIYNLSALLKNLVLVQGNHITAKSENKKHFTDFFRMNFHKSFVGTSFD